MAGFAETAELAVRISLKDNVSAGVRGLQGRLAGLNGSLGRVGRGVGQIGTGLARAGLLVGGAAITGISAAAKAASDFEDAFAGVRKTVNATDLAAAGLTFDDLAASFRNLATEIPISAVELAHLGETAGALGIKAQDIEEFTRITAELGITTNLTADQAAESLGKIGTILGLTGRDFADFADVLVNLGNQGASTEDEIIEITKRFAAMGHQAGLSTPQILALSSAAASLGIEPEAAGGALSRIFANMATEIANSTAKGKAFAEITGTSLAKLKKQVDKGGSLGILQSTLKGIAGLSRTEAASVLKALGITNSRDRNAILLMAQNLGFVNDQLEIAKGSAGALEREASIKFATTASKITLLKQNAIEAAMVFGTELLPAIGKAADKAIGFLKDPKTRATLKSLGQDVAKAIESINWDQVRDGAVAFKDALKGALDFILLLASAVDKLPTQIKAAAGGFLVLNKLSGGLIGAGVGNVVGGLAGAATRGIAAHLPGVGRLFAQPVFVTNWPLGGLGGGSGLPIGAAGGAAGSGIAATVTAAASALAAGAGLGLLMAAVGEWVLANSKDPTGVIARTTTATARGLPASGVNPTRGFGQIDPMADWVKANGGLQQAVENLDPDIEKSSRRTVEQLKVQQKGIEAKTAALRETFIEKMTRLDSGIAGTTNAIRDKDLSVTVPVHVSVPISIRDVNQGTTSHSTYSVTFANKMTRLEIF